MSKGRNFSEIAPNIAFPKFKFTNSTIQLSRRANWAGYEIASSARDGRELRSGKEKHEPEAGTQVVLHA